MVGWFFRSARRCDTSSINTYCLIMIYEQKFLSALFFTILVETPILFIFIRRIYKIRKSELPNSLLLFSGFICSFATLPYLWFILTMFINARVPFVISGELLAIAIESIILRFVLKLDIYKAGITSFFCNALSFLLGLLLLT